MKIIVATILLLCAQPVWAQKLNVKIVNKENHDSSYDYAGAYSFGNSVTATAATFHVTGATLTLQLPDGRLAVVNCAGKFAEHFAGPAGNRRSCHEPPSQLLFYAHENGAHETC